MPLPSHSPCVYNPNNIWWKVQVTKLFIMQSSPVSYHFLLPVSLFLYDYISFQNAEVYTSPTIIWYSAAWCSGNDLDSYSGSIWFELRPSNGLSETHITRCHNTQDHDLNLHRREDVKTIPTNVYGGLLKYLKANVRTVPWNRPRPPLPHHSLYMFIAIF
jgi:hypothetical protein